MNLNFNEKKPLFQGFARLASGILIAFVLYHLALNYATRDCQSIHQNLQEQGPWVMVILLAVLTVFSFFGVPATIIAIGAGVLMGPIVGAPLTSLAVALSSIAAWSISRNLFRSGKLPTFVELKLNSDWYERMMNDRADSGFHWVTSHAMTSPLPYSFFAGVVGAKVRHLTLPSLIAAIFLSSILHVAGYSLAGASIGCAVINHALGLSIDQYRTLMAVSCLLLVLLSRLQSTIARKRNS